MVAKAKNAVRTELVNTICRCKYEGVFGLHSHNDKYRITTYCSCSQSCFSLGCSLHTGSSSSTSLLSVDVEERFHKQGSFANLVAVWDSTCVAARTHRVGKYKKHERGRAASVSHCNRKVSGKVLPCDY